jgi:hypothetical protein
VRGRRAAVSGLLLVGVLATAPAAPVVPPARAEHAIEYRYTVLGYVTDAAGRPRQGVRVELVREKTSFSYLGETDQTGFYVIIARLGDESAGEPLSLRADGQTVALRARMDPADHETERGTQVDFTGRRLLERPTAFAPTLKRFLSQ